MAIRKPLDIAFDVVDDDGATRGDLEIQLGDHGQILTVFVGGIKLKGMMDVHEFVERLLGQGYLVAKSDKAKMEFENDNFKSQRDYDLIRRDGA